MRFLKLNINSDKGHDLISKGAFYSDELAGWYVNASQVNYPRSNNSNFVGLKSGECYEPSTEAELKRILVDMLSNSFVVHEEVPGLHCLGGHCSIDLVIEPRNKAGWKNPSAALGIELKNICPDSKTDYTHWIKQCIDYSHTNWNGFGYIPIFMGPGALGFYRGRGARHIRELLSTYRIGFIDTDNGFQFVLADKTVWCMYHGVQDMGRKSNLMPYFGSR